MINLSFIRKLPTDIIINHIIPFTYHIQSVLLQEDIKNFVTSKDNLFEMFKKNKILFNKNIIFVPLLDKDVIEAIILYLLNFIFHIIYMDYSIDYVKYNKNIKKMMLIKPKYTFNKIWLSLNKNQRNNFFEIRKFQFDQIIKNNNL
jgi:hypothetical protein